VKHFKLKFSSFKSTQIVTTGGIQRLGKLWYKAIRYLFDTQRLPGCAILQMVRGCQFFLR